MKSFTGQPAAASNMTPWALEIRDKLHRSCQLSSIASPQIFNSMALEISSLSQQPFAQYTADASLRGDLSGDSTTTKLSTLLKPEQHVIDQIFVMTLVTYQHAQQHMAMIDPLAASQHIITFQISPAAQNEYPEKKSDAECDDDDDDHDDGDNDDIKDGEIFNDCHFLKNDNNRYKQRECRFYHIAVDLQRSVYHKYSVTSIIAPYGVVEGKHRGYLLYKAADLYPTFNHSIQFLYTSMMGMVYLDAVFTASNGEKLGKRIMTIADLVSFVSTCFGLPQQMEDTHKWNSFGVKMQTDWDYIKYIAATYGKSVSESFKELVIHAVIDYTYNTKSPSPPSHHSFIQVPSSYHIQSDEIHTLLQMIGIPSDYLDIDSYHQFEDEEDKEDEDIWHDSKNIDEHVIKGMLAMLNAIYAQNGATLNQLNQWQDVEDPYMELHDFPENENMKV